MVTKMFVKKPMFASVFCAVHTRAVTMQCSQRTARRAAFAVPSNFFHIMHSKITTFLTTFASKLDF